MPGEPYFPLTARPFALLLALLACLLIAHLLLIKWFPLGKLGWKIVDYVWLGVSVLALFGAALGVRHLLAKGQLETHEALMEWAYTELRSDAAFLTGGAVCRTFIGDLERSQDEYDAICRYGRALVASLPAAAPPDPSSLKWPARPPVTDGLLADLLAHFDRTKAAYVRTTRTLDALRNDAQTGESDLTLAVVSPFFLMLALALRITKVTGEILLDRPRRTP